MNFIDFRFSFHFYLGAMGNWNRNRNTPYPQWSSKVCKWNYIINLCFKQIWCYGVLSEARSQCCEYCRKTFLTLKKNFNVLYSEHFLISWVFRNDEASILFKEEKQNGKIYSPKGLNHYYKRLYLLCLAST